MDNHPQLLRFMTGLLEGEGHAVVTAKDALDALELLESEQPSIIFIDLVMPHIRGDQLCRIIRGLEPFKSVRIIMLSAIAAEDPTDFKAFGADACIAKGPSREMAGHVLDVLARLSSPQQKEPSDRILGRETLYERQITKELLSIQKHTGTILDILHEGLLELTADGKIIFGNAMAFHILGLPEEKVLATDFRALFEPKAQKKITGFLKNTTASPAQLPPDPDLSTPFGDKELALKFLPLRGEANSHHIVTIRDITESTRMAAALEKSEGRCRLLFNKMNSGFVLLESETGLGLAGCRFVEANPAFEKMVGHSREFLLNRPVDQLFQEQDEFWAGIFEQVVENAPFARLERHNRLRRKYYEITAYTPQQGQFGVFFYDITERKLLERRLQEASITDDLTQVLNRRGFLTLAEKQLRIAARTKSVMYLLFADIDNLKLINDTLGHSVGDQTVKEMAELLQETFRQSDIMGRLGGDEFAVLLTGPPGKNIDTAVEQRLEKGLKKRNSRQGREYELSLSHGMVRYDPEKPTSLTDLLSTADHLMYTLKQQKRQRLRGGKQARSSS